MEFHGRKRVQRTQASASGGDGAGRKTRIGGATPDGDSAKVVLDRPLLDRPLTVNELAGKMTIRDIDVIKELFTMEQMRTVNQIVELGFAKDVALKLGFEVISTDPQSE